MRSLCLISYVDNLSFNIWNIRHLINSIAFILVNSGLKSKINDKNKTSTIVILFSLSVTFVRYLIELTKKDVKRRTEYATTKNSFHFLDEADKIESNEFPVKNSYVHRSVWRQTILIKLKFWFAHFQIGWPTTKERKKKEEKELVQIFFYIR